MLNCPCHTQNFCRNSLSVSYPLPYPTTIGEKGEPKTTIQGWPLALLVCFAAVVLLWRCATLFIILLASVACPRCLGWLAWHVPTDDERTTAGGRGKGATTRMGVRGWNDTRPCIEHIYESL